MLQKWWKLALQCSIFSNRRWLLHIMLGKRLIVTSDQKSCLRFLICGSEYTCCSFFRFYCMYHLSFPVVSQQLVSWMNLNVRSPKLACRESYGEENLTQFIQKISSKWICGASCFRQRSRFLTEIKPSELESDISRIEWRRKFETIHSRHWFKNCSNWICAASCFRERIGFWLKSKLQNSNLASRESSGELILHCFARTLSEAITQVSKIKK